MPYKFGLNRSPHPPQLNFKTYLLPPLLPPIPATFGHKNLFPRRGWGMLKNDTIGDCAIVGPMHVVMLWNAVVKKQVRFTDRNAVADYSAISGYVPGDESTDVGANMVDVAKYWQQTGFRDAKGKRHKILTFLHIEPKHLDYIDAAGFLFDAVGLGIQVGRDELTAFDRGEPWTNPNSPVDGYHYVPMIYKDSDFRTVVTWGGEQQVGEAWLHAKVNEVVAILSTENLIGGKSLEGFDIEHLENDLEALG